MKALFSRPAFTGFGPHGLAGTSEVKPPHVLRGRRASRLRAGVREQCPRLPGVYGMVDGAGELIYVGKAKCLRSRLLSYFRPKSRGPKAGRILEDTRRLVWELAPDEFAALLRELELIRRWQPRFNVQGQPGRRRRTYVCLGRRPAPYAFLAAQPPATAVDRFGPVPAGERAREAVRRVNDWFRLRDCPQSQAMVFADQRELFPVLLTPGCLRHEIETCLGPCASACSRSDYSRQVRAARAFLEGKDASPLQTLERDMAAASAALAYERAAALRDKLDVLRWLSDHLERLRQASQKSFVYPVTGHDGSELWYLIHRGRVQGVTPAPRDATSRKTATALLDMVYRKAVPAPGPPALEEMDDVLLVAGWFGRHREERQRTRPPEQARAACEGSSALRG